MAMSGTVLGQAIYSKLVDGKLGEDASKEVLQAWQTIAAEIVSHIQTYGTITVTVATTGSATAQSGTGTGSIS